MLSETRIPHVDLRRVLPYRQAAGEPKARLFCFPYAGGSAAIYRDWSSLLPSSLEVCAVELPGHGMRFGEPPIGDVQRLADHLSEVLAPLFDRPLVMFGHSLGAQVAFAMARRQPRTVGALFSAAPAAHLPPRRFRSRMSTADLILELRRLGGTPRDVLEEPDLLELFLPVVRADFSLLENARAPNDARLMCPVHVLAACDDEEVDFADAGQWSVLAGADYQFTEMWGGHFYLHARRDAVLEQVRYALTCWL